MLRRKLHATELLARSVSEGTEQTTRRIREVNTGESILSVFL